MRKFKIFTTCFILYEFAVITILQIQSFCIATFGHSFCVLHNYKYFLLCVIVPVFVGLISWWMPKPKTNVEQEKSFQDILVHSIPKQYIRHLIMALIVVGIKNFSANHPKTKKFFDDVLKTVGKNDNLTK